MLAWLTSCYAAYHIICHWQCNYLWPLISIVLDYCLNNIDQYLFYLSFFCCLSILFIDLLGPCGCELHVITMLFARLFYLPEGAWLCFVKVGQTWCDWRWDALPIVYLSLGPYLWACKDTIVVIYHNLCFFLGPQPACLLLLGCNLISGNVCKNHDKCNSI